MKVAKGFIKSFEKCAPRNAVGDPCSNTNNIDQRAAEALPPFLALIYAMPKSKIKRF